MHAIPIGDVDGMNLDREHCISYVDGIKGEETGHTHFAAYSLGVFSSISPLGSRMAVVSIWMTSKPWPTSVRQN